jgi:hypothetical protein
MCANYFVFDLTTEMEERNVQLLSVDEMCVQLLKPHDIDRIFGYVSSTRAISIHIICVAAVLISNKMYRVLYQQMSDNS